MDVTSKDYFGLTFYLRGIDKFCQLKCTNRNPSLSDKFKNEFLPRILSAIGAYYVLPKISLVGGIYQSLLFTYKFSLHVILPAIRQTATNDEILQPAEECAEHLIRAVYNFSIHFFKKTDAAFFLFPYFVLRQYQKLEGPLVLPNQSETPNQQVAQQPAAASQPFLGGHPPPYAYVTLVNTLMTQPMTPPTSGYPLNYPSAATAAQPASLPLPGNIPSFCHFNASAPPPPMEDLPPALPADVIHPLPRPIAEEPYIKKLSRFLAGRLLNKLKPEDDIIEPIKIVIFNWKEYVGDVHKIWKIATQVFEALLASNITPDQNRTAQPPSYPE